MLNPGKLFWHGLGSTRSTRPCFIVLKRVRSSITDLDKTSMRMQDLRKSPNLYHPVGGGSVHSRFFFTKQQLISLFSKEASWRDQHSSESWSLCKVFATDWGKRMPNNSALSWIGPNESFVSGVSSLCVTDTLDFKFSYFRV